VSDNLYDKLDQAAAAILEAALGEATLQEGEERIPVPLAERIRAFESVLKYADSRAKTAPKPVVESRFSNVKQQFNGAKTPRRGRRAETGSDSDAG
jgi:hypothetical protein